MNKIGIFTPYPIEPIHPRTELIYRLLKKNGYEVAIIYNSNNRIGFFRILSPLFLFYFDFGALFSLSRKIGQFDIIYIQSLRNLPLAIWAKIKKKKIIYETIDNNVHLNFFHLCKQLKLLHRFKIILKIFERIEKFIAFHSTDIIIVNSLALDLYFNNKTAIIFYASPLEDVNSNSTCKSSTVLLYLGLFAKMKGADQIIDFSIKNNIPCYIFGTIEEGELKEIIDNNPLFKREDRMDSENLGKKLDALSDKYNILGFSLTQPVNLSNATQEINKDIDYLAMGIPIIGNYRRPTKTKIEAGCGIYFDEQQKLEAMIDRPEIICKAALVCKDYYHKNYSQDIFNKKLKKNLNLIND